VSWRHDAERLDVAVYAAIARTPSPALDRWLSRLSRAADYSRLSIAVAGALSVLGGPEGRRAARGGLASVAVTAAIVNLAIKPFTRRRRPDRVAQEVPVARHVRMPASRSFPSGHAAAAFAFATGVAHASPTALVAYSRVHTGVHYPGDVIVGALVGVTLAEGTMRALEGRATPAQPYPQR
jgi:membrane-associated phospholipid phosphatase